MNDFAVADDVREVGFGWRVPIVDADIASWRVPTLTADIASAWQVPMYTSNEEPFYQSRSVEDVAFGGRIFDGLGGTGYIAAPDRCVPSHTLHGSQYGPENAQRMVGSIQGPKQVPCTFGANDALCIANQLRPSSPSWEMVPPMLGSAIMPVRRTLLQSSTQHMQTNIKPPAREQGIREKFGDHSREEAAVMSQTKIVQLEEECRARERQLEVALMAVDARNVGQQRLDDDRLAEGLIRSYYEAAQENLEQLSKNLNDREAEFRKCEESAARSQCQRREEREEEEAARESIRHEARLDQQERFAVMTKKWKETKEDVAVLCNEERARFAAAQHRRKHGLPQLPRWLASIDSELERGESALREISIWCSETQRLNTSSCDGILERVDVGKKSETTKIRRSPTAATLRTKAKEGASALEAFGNLGQSVQQNPAKGRKLRQRSKDFGQSDSPARQHSTELEQGDPWPRKRTTQLRAKAKQGLSRALRSGSLGSCIKDRKATQELGHLKTELDLSGGEEEGTPMTFHVSEPLPMTVQVSEPLDNSVAAPVEGQNDVVAMLAEGAGKWKAVVVDESCGNLVDQIRLQQRNGRSTDFAESPEISLDIAVLDEQSKCVYQLAYEWDPREQVIAAQSEDSAKCIESPEFSLWGVPGFTMLYWPNWDVVRTKACLRLLGPDGRDMLPRCKLGVGMPLATGEDISKEVELNQFCHGRPASQIFYFSTPVARGPSGSVDTLWVAIEHVRPPTFSE